MLAGQTLNGFPDWGAPNVKPLAQAEFGDHAARRNSHGSARLFKLLVCEVGLFGLWPWNLLRPCRFLSDRGLAGCDCPWPVLPGSGVLCWHIYVGIGHRPQSRELIVVNAGILCLHSMISLTYQHNSSPSINVRVAV